LNQIRAAESIHSLEVLCLDLLDVRDRIRAVRARITAHCDSTSMAAELVSDGFIATPAELADAWESTWQVQQTLDTQAQVMARICKPLD
jgi:hypothetical protein